MSTVVIVKTCRNIQGILDGRTNNIKRARAITISEMVNLYRRHKNSVVVVYDVNSKEVDKFKELLTSNCLDRQRCLLYTDCGLSTVDTGIKAVTSNAELIQEIKNIENRIKFGGTVGDQEVENQEVEDQVAEDQVEVEDIEDQVEVENIEDQVEVGDQEVEDQEVENIEDQVEVEDIEDQVAEEAENIEEVENQVDTVIEDQVEVEEQSVEENIDYTEKDNKIKDLEDENSTLKAKVIDITGLLSKANRDIEKLNIEINSLKTLEINNKSTEELVNSLNNDLEEKNILIDNLNKQLVDLQTNDNANLELINSLNEQVANLNKQIDDLKNQIVELNNIIVLRDTQIEDLSNNTELQDKYNSLKEQLEESNNSLADINITLLNKESIIEELNINLEADKNLISSLNNSISDKDRQIEELNIDNELKADNISNLQVEKDNVEAKLTSLNEDNVKLNNTINDLTTKVEVLKRDKESIESELLNFNSKIKKVTSGKLSIEELRNPENLVQPFEYFKKAKIVTVTGAGSFGITTTAMSIANKLSWTNSVLYIDLDLVNPKADTWFKQKPFVETDKITKNKIGNTGLGLLVTQGIEVYSKYKRNIIKRVITNRKGYIDYISGIYFDIESKYIANAQWKELIDFVGNTYNYIVVDLGKLGNSRLNDSLIRAFVSIGHSNFVVTTPDEFDIRSFRIRLSANFSAEVINKMLWICNMSSSSKLKNLASIAIGDIRYCILPFEQKLRGNRMDFYKMQLIRDKFDWFLDTVKLGE